jgi:hypothetical protein
MRASGVVTTGQMANYFKSDGHLAADPMADQDAMAVCDLRPWSRRAFRPIMR